MQQWSLLVVSFLLSPVPGSRSSHLLKPRSPGLLGTPTLIGS
uniref:A disintegrin and metallopeptidase domain 28 n=1 Tax=Mus musculus TaxID=10090 RepID=A0A2R8VHR5_MOUSE